VPKTLTAVMVPCEQQAKQTEAPKQAATPQK
jgi:hypothetical protein